MHTCIPVPIQPFFNCIWEIIKTSHAQIFFLFFSIMERVRKGSDLPKKKWGSPSVQQIMFCWVFDSVCALENDVARAWPMNSVCTRDAQ